MESTLSYFVTPTLLDPSLSTTVVSARVSIDQSQVEEC
jgi:hypothetical protein